MKVMQDEMRKKLTKLTIQSNSAIESLKEKEEKATAILRFAEMCRKLETEEEKVLPFYASSLTKEEENDVTQAVYENPTKDLADVRAKNINKPQICFKYLLNIVFLY
jgi:hypothetical protein